MTVSLSGIVLNLTAKSWQLLSGQLGLQDSDCSPQNVGDGRAEEAERLACGAPNIRCSVAQVP